MTLKSFLLSVPSSALFLIKNQVVSFSISKPDHQAGDNMFVDFAAKTAVKMNNAFTSMVKLSNLFIEAV